MKASWHAARRLELFFESLVPVLSLCNRTGDPDIYVSEKVARPTFDLENHCASAAKPGADSLLVPRWWVDLPVRRQPSVVFHNPPMNTIEAIQRTSFSLC